AVDTTLLDRVLEASVPENELQLEGLNASTKYYWAVRVNDDRGASDWSDVNVFTTRPDPIETESEPVTYTFDFGSTSGSPSDPTAPRSEPRQPDYRMSSLPGTDNIRWDSFFPGPYNDAWRAFIETGDPLDYYDEY